MNKKNITNALKVVINKKTVLPILESVYLSGEHLQVTDLETYISIPYESGINACIPADVFMSALDIMSNPSFKTTEIKDEKGNITIPTEISSGSRTIKVTSDDPSNFPNSPFQFSDAPDFFHVGEIDATELEYLEEAMAFTSKDELRPAMTGVYIGKDVVGTDAHRLFWRPLKNMDEEFILSKKTIKAMLVFGGSWQVYCGINYRACEDNKQQEPEIERKWGAFLNEEGVLITFRPIEAKFPDYKAVIPDSTPAASLEIAPAILRKELSHALKFCNEGTKLGVFSLNGHAKLCSSDLDMQKEYEVTFEEKQVKYEGELAIGFNMKFLDEIASLLQKGETMEFKFWSSSKCAIINNRYLLMPVMITNNN
jgi:DNA polymerase III sliding clamp (beta) subunit (PCNA family)